MCLMCISHIFHPSFGAKLHIFHPSFGTKLHIFHPSFGTKLHIFLKMRYIFETFFQIMQLVESFSQKKFFTEKLNK